VPTWLAERWFAELGAAEARALLAAINEPAESALRANTLVTTRDDLLAAVPGHASDTDPDAIVLDAPFDAHGHALFAAGAYQPQSRASQRVARAVDPQPGERVLDLCAAPGGKTTHLAALMTEGAVVAVEHHAGRADQLNHTVARLRADGIVRVDTADAAAPRADGPFDRVLVDPPCSGLGTLQSRPDRRWHATADAPLELQARILDAAAAAGPQRIVYSTCTISRNENEDQVAAFIKRHPAYTLSGEHVTLPHRDRTDGFYIATLEHA
jgi:16S rRNA (cytosine967-C5)-methyltransferase